MKTPTSFLIPRLALASFLVLFATVQAVLFFVPLFYGMTWSQPEFLRLRVINDFLLFWTVLVYAFHRARFHPVFNTPYRKWLALTPWRPEMELPLGPMTLVWQDVLFVGGVAALQWLTGLKTPWMAVLVFLIIYLIAMLLALGITQGYVEVFLALWIAPVMFLVSQWTWAVAGVALAIYLVIHIGLHRSLRRFPWKLDLPRKVPDPLGWPFLRLGPVTIDAAMPKGGSAIGGALVAWWFYAWTIGLTPELQQSRPDDARLLLLLCGGIFALLRLLAFIMGTAPPLSIAGRFVTRRLVIPQYDRVFLTPLCAIAVGWLMPTVLQSLGLSILTTAALTIGVMVTVLGEGGPSLRKWKLTGQFRILPSLATPTYQRLR